MNNNVNEESSVEDSTIMTERRAISIPKQRWAATSLQKSESGFSYNISANTLRSPNLKCSFGIGTRDSTRNDEKKDYVDAFYTLPSTFQDKGTTFSNRTESKNKLSFMKASRGGDAPSPQQYQVKRLFDEDHLSRSPTGSPTHREQAAINTSFESRTSMKHQPTRCTFGIPYKHYKHVVVGSVSMLSDTNLQSPARAPQTGRASMAAASSKQKICID